MLSGTTIFDNDTSGQPRIRDLRMDTDSSNPNRSWKTNIVGGAISGLRIWLVYGVVEFVLTCVVPMLAQRETTVPGWQWHLFGLVFGVYAMCGVFLGGAGGALVLWTGMCKKSNPRSAHEIIAALTLVLAFVANGVLAWPPARSEYIALAMAVLLAGGFAGASASIISLKHVLVLANPWTVSLLLLAWPWVGNDMLHSYSVILRMTVFLVLVGLVVGLSTISRSWRLGTIKRTLKPAVTAGIATMLLLIGVGKGKTHMVQETQISGLATGSRCNVVLITMDTVRADHLSVYGYERNTTPRLREFAREATVYTRAIAASDLTLSSHASIFTGLYPSWHGAYVVPGEYPEGRPLSPNAVTLAEVLRSQGYRTMSVAANTAYLQEPMGLTKGFEISDVHGAVRLCCSHLYLRESARRALNLLTDTNAFDAVELRSADINERALALLEETKRKSPFFLFINYMDSHMPYVPPSPFNAQFDGRDLHFKPYADHKLLTYEVDFGKRHVTATERRHLVSQYDGGIAYMDYEMGKLFSRLRELGLYENTLIIITGDHGEAFGERDVVQHAMGSAYQDEVHVPLLIKYPGQHEERRSDALVSHVDLMPTVLDFAGYVSPPNLQGRTLRQPRAGDSPVYAESRAMGFLTSPRFRGVRRAIFVGSWELIAWSEGPPELYNLATDPDENNNLYRVADRHAKALADRLSAWVAASPRQFEKPGNLDKSRVEKLKSLGYAQ